MRSEERSIRGLMHLQSLNEYYEKKSIKVDHQTKNTPDVFLLEDQYEQALKLESQNSNVQAIEILEKLLRNDLLDIDIKMSKIHSELRQEKVSTSIEIEPPSSTISKQSQRSREFALQLKKCILKNLSLLYEKVDRINDSLGCHSMLYCLDSNDVVVCYNYAVCLFNCSQIIPSYKLFMECIKLFPTHWKSYEYLLVCFYLIKDIIMCNFIIKKVAERVDLFMPSYVICYLLIVEDGVDQNRLHYNKDSIQLINQDYESLFESTKDSIFLRIKKYKNALERKNSKINVNPEVICVNRQYTTQYCPSFQWNYLSKSYYYIGRFLLDIYQNLNIKSTDNFDDIVFTIDLKSIEFQKNDSPPTNEPLDLIVSPIDNPIKTNPNDDIVVIISDEGSDEDEEAREGNKDTVKHFTRRQTRTKEKEPVVINLYEKFYSILRDLIPHGNSSSYTSADSRFSSMETNPDNKSLNCNEFLINIDSASTNFNDNIDDFLISNSTIVIYLDIVHRYLKQYIKFDCSFALNDWSLQLCRDYVDLGRLFYNRRDITPVYWNNSVNIPTEDYVLNAFVMLRLLEIEFILLTGSSSTSHTHQQTSFIKIDNMLEYIDTVVVFCKVKLREATHNKHNPPMPLLLMVIRQSWLLAHYHMTTNPNNYCTIETQLANCKEYLETYELEYVNIFPHATNNISMIQIENMTESLNVRKKINGFQNVIQSRNYSRALKILKSCNIKIPERRYIEHQLIKSTDTCNIIPSSIDLSFNIDSDGNGCRSNIQKQLTLLITCYSGLGKLSQVTKCVLSSMWFCLKDFRSCALDNNDKMAVVSKLKQLFNCWNLETGFSQLDVCLKQHACCVDNETNHNLTPTHSSPDTNLFTDALAQLSNLFCLFLECHGDPWADLMSVRCVKLLWLLTKHLAVSSGSNKMKSIVFHMADELITVLMVNGNICCREPLAKCVLSDILLDLNELYTHNCLKRFRPMPILNNESQCNTVSVDNSINLSSLETSFSDEFCRNTMLLYYSCLIGYPSSSKIKNLTRNGVVHHQMNGVGCNSNNRVESVPFPLVMTAFELFKPEDSVTLGPYLFKISSSIIGNSRPSLTNDLYKLFQILTNIIIHELELAFDNFYQQCKNIANFIKCHKKHSASDFFKQCSFLKTKIPTHLYNSRVVLQFVIEYHLRLALVQGGKQLKEARKIITIYLFLAPNDYFGWWATFCYLLHYVNFEVVDYYDLQTTINISVNHKPNVVLDKSKQRKLYRLANLSLNVLEFGISLCCDFDTVVVMQLDLARASQLYSTYEYCVCMFGVVQNENTLKQPFCDLLANHLKNHHVYFENFLIDHCNVFHLMNNESVNSNCNMCSIFNVRSHLQTFSYKKFKRLALVANKNSTCDELCDASNAQDNVSSSSNNSSVTWLIWYIYYMAYKSGVLRDTKNINTLKSARLLTDTMTAYLRHVNCSLEHLDKFLLQQHLSDSTKCFYQLLASFFNFMCEHTPHCTLNSITMDSQSLTHTCFCRNLKSQLESMMHSITRIDRNQECVEFVNDCLLLTTNAPTTYDKWTSLIHTFSQLDYCCSIHGSNISIKMCDMHLMTILDRTMIYVIVILKRFYSNYDYVRLLVRYVDERSKGCHLVKLFIQFIITGSVTYFHKIFLSKSAFDEASELFGFTKIAKYLKPTYPGFINLFGKGHLFKHAWRTGIEEIESLDDFQYSVTSVLALFVHLVSQLPTKEDAFARLALKIDSNTTRSYLLPYKGVTIIKTIIFYLINQVVQFKHHLLSEGVKFEFDVPTATKYLYISLKIYKSNLLFEKSKRNDLLVCLDVIHSRLTNRELPSKAEYPAFFTAQQKKEILDQANKHLTLVKYTFQ